MNCIIQSHQNPISRNTRQVILRKVNKLNKLFNNIQQCEVDIRSISKNNKTNFLVEIRLAVPSTVLFAHQQSDRIQSALDEALTHLEKQLIKYKGRRSDHSHHRNRNTDLTSTDVDV